MNNVLRYTIIALAGLILCGVICISIFSGKQERKPLKCIGIAVTVTDSLENDFISSADVKRYIEREYGQCTGMPADSIDLAKIESIVDGRSAVLKSQAFVTKDGMLNIHVSQRKPVVRFQKSDGGFYADAEGFVFPLQSSYASRVHIIDGEIPINMKSGHKGMIEDPAQKAWFDKVMKVINYIENSKTWKDRIVQIHVSNGGELTMIPRNGKERFIFGQPERIEEKFSKMEKYYSAIAFRKGQEHYSTVNVEYKGQIVCR